MRICAAGALVRGTKVLLGLRSHATTLYPDKWDVFGGHCEEGEGVEQALTRELQEELGVRPVRYEFLAMFEEPNPREHGDGQYHFFAVYEWTGEPLSLGDEHQKIRWFDISELPRIDLASELYIGLFSGSGGADA